MKVRRRIAKHKCTVPGCRFKRRMCSPGDWCRRHWNRWIDWAHWDFSGERPEPVGQPLWMREPVRRWCSICGRELIRPVTGADRKNGICPKIALRAARRDARPGDSEAIIVGVAIHRAALEPEKLKEEPHP